MNSLLSFVTLFLASLNLLHIFGGRSGFGAALGVSLEPMEVKL